MKSLQALKDAPNAEFTFLTVVKDPMTQDATTGEKTQNYKFVLAQPMEVRGISPIYDPATRNSAPVYDYLKDVVEIRVNEELLLTLEDELTLNNPEDIRDGGVYKGKCYLDISSRRDVWLTQTRLSDYGKTSYIKKGRERYLGLAALMDQHPKK
jgi:hypothetical protein